MIRQLGLLTLLMGLFLVAVVGARPGGLAPGVVASSPAEPVTEERVQAASSVLRQAYDLLLDRYVVPPSPVTLLEGAIGGVRTWASRNHHAAAAGPFPVPGWQDDREADWAAFAVAWTGWFSTLPAADGLEHAVLRAMAASLGEAHTTWISPEAMRRTQANQRGDYSRFGLGFRYASDGTVLDVDEGSAAAGAGLRRGDQVLAVDGVRLPDGAQRLRSLADGQVVRLLVDPVGPEGPREVSMAAGIHTAPWITAEILPGEIGYLRIRRFEFLARDGDGQRQLDAAFAVLQERPLAGLVVDVRDNPGGSVATGNAVISRITGQVPLYRQEERNQAEAVVRGRARALVPASVPVAVLQNRASASMAEITAMALDQARAAITVGQRTRGVVATAVTVGLSDGSGLTITVSIVTGLDGLVVNGVGLAPEVPAELDLARLRAGVDTQLEAALGALRRQAELPVQADPDLDGSDTAALPAAA